MKAILLMCAIMSTSISLLAQNETMRANQQAIQQSQQQQPTQNGGMRSSSRLCGIPSVLGRSSVIQPMSQFTEFGQFVARQMQFLTAPLQNEAYVLNIPPWSVWQVVPLSQGTVFSVKPGVVKPGTKVRIRWRGEENELVYYTTNGWSPNPSSIPYREPITISGPTHIQAIEISQGFDNNACPNWRRSQILDAYYDVASSASVPRTPAVVTDGLLRQGTVLKLVTSATVNSQSAKPGDRVPLLLKQDITVGDAVVIPKGTTVDAVFAEAIPSQTSHTGGMLIIAVHSLNKAGISIGLHGVETMEGRPGRAPKEAVIETGMSLEAIVTTDVKLQP
jgi:hypothetical protein